MKREPTLSYSANCTRSSWEQLLPTGHRLIIPLRNSTNVPLQQRGWSVKQAHRLIIPLQNSTNILLQQRGWSVKQAHRLITPLRNSTNVPLQQRGWSVKQGHKLIILSTNIPLQQRLKYKRTHIDHPITELHKHTSATKRLKYQTWTHVDHPITELCKHTSATKVEIANKDTCRSSHYRTLQTCLCNKVSNKRSYTSWS